MLNSPSVPFFFFFSEMLSFWPIFTPFCPIFLPLNRGSVQIFPFHASKIAHILPNPKYYYYYHYYWLANHWAAMIVVFFSGWVPQIWGNLPQNRTDAHAIVPVELPLCLLAVIQCHQKCQWVLSAAKEKKRKERGFPPKNPILCFPKMKSIFF